MTSDASNTTVNGPASALADRSAEASVGRVVAGWRETFASGRTRSLHWRVGQLKAIERLRNEREDKIAALAGAAR